jgi:hypothetical protein
MTIVRVAPFIVLIALAGACATGSTYRSGVGDKLLERAPFYAGAGRDPIDSTPIGHFPIAYQRGSTQAAIFEPRDGDGSPIARLLLEMTAYLDSLRVTESLVAVRTGTPPDVRFSCATDPAEPSDECATGDGGAALGRDDIRMLLSVGRPSADWVATAQSRMALNGVGTAILITLEIGQYRIRQRGLRGDKDVELGTEYVANFPWLTSLETPVPVLQLTGVLVGRDGQALRIGAEGLIARRTSLPLSAIGAQALITDEEVEQARTARRADLPGQPLVWRVALRHLIRGLAER